jgi:hypothetical protein
VQEDSYPRWFKKIPANLKPAIALEVNPYPKWLTWIGLGFTSFLCVFSFWEWFTISVLEDESVIIDYSLVYNTPKTYATSELHVAFFCLPIVVVFVLAIRKDTPLYRLLALAFIIVAIALARILG